MANAAAGLCRADEAAVFVFKDGAYRWAASAHIASTYVDVVKGETFIPGNDSLVGRTALRGTVVQIEDAPNDPDYGRRDLAQLGGARTLLGFPLQREDATIGVMVLTRRHVERFIGKRIEILKIFADQAAIAIENVRLFNEVQALNKGLEAKVVAQVDELDASAGCAASWHRSSPRPSSRPATRASWAIIGARSWRCSATCAASPPSPRPRSPRTSCRSRRVSRCAGPADPPVRGHDATLGRIGFEDRFDHTAIGAVINLAARLCAEAEDGQVLVSGRLSAAAEVVAEIEPLGERQLKGMARPVGVVCPGPSRPKLLKEIGKLAWNTSGREAFISHALPERKERQMSDYIPNPPNPERDPRNYDRYYEDNSGKGVTLVVGILVAIALAAGLMFFAGSPSERTDQAQLPAQERTMTLPANPAPATPPARPATNPQQ